MIQAYKNFWQNYLNFSGRSTRSDYWWVVLIHNIILLPFNFSYFSAEANNNSAEALQTLSSFGGFYIILGLVLFLPSIALQVRRLRDAGKHSICIFLPLIPFIGWFLLIMLNCFPSEKVEIPEGYDYQELQGQHFGQDSEE